MFVYALKLVNYLIILVVMKKIYTLSVLLFVVVALFTSCGRGNEFVIKGNLGTEKGETFIALFDDPIAKIDTIRPIEGEFEYSFIPDTSTLFRLVNKEGKIIPVFAEKGWEVVYKGTFDQPEIKGDGCNREYNDFIKQIDNVENTDSIADIAEEFIRQHSYSFVSAYLIDKYFIQVSDPDMDKVESLILPLNGEVKDSRVINVALKSIPERDERNKKSVGYFSLSDRNGKYVSWNLQKDQYMILNFWASWNEKSKKTSDSLYNQVKKFPKKRVKVLNISLDYDQKNWLEACKDDRDFWIEICQFNGWETSILKSNNVQRLPSNILLDSHRNILAKDIFNQELKDFLNKKGVK